MSLLAACGSRSTLLDGDQAPLAPAGAAGTSSAPRLKSWDRVTWDVPLDEAAVYLWTGSVSDAWAVVSTDPSPDGSFYREHWNGSEWTRTASEHNPTRRFARQQVWGAGSGQAFGGSSSGVERWLGATWSAWGASPACSAIGGSREDDIWCANETELWHYDGATWTRTPLAGVEGVLALARDDAWVWGANGASHFDGLSWTLQLPGLVRSLSASGPDDVWAVQDGDVLHGAGAGTAWTRQNPTGSQIAAVWSQSRTNTWIVAAGAAMRWDGSRWLTLELPVQDELMCLSGSNQDVWIGGTLKLLHGRADGAGI